MTLATRPVLEVTGIHKQFPGVKALSDAGLRLFPGEVHTLVGQNGAGKSTLIKVLTGAYQPDSGSIVLNGQAIHPRYFPPSLVIACVLLMGAAFGAAMGLNIQLFKLQPFIVTLAGMFLARGLCYLISIDSIAIDQPFFVALSQTQIHFLRGFLSPSAIIALVVLLLAVWLAHFASFGRAVYAVGGNEQSAAMMGLNVGVTKVAVYPLSGFCAALGGLLFAVYMLSGYGQHGQGTELDAIAAVVIGALLFVFCVVQRVMSGHSRR